MLVSNLDNMTKGWFIGDFKPSVLRTKEFEVAVQFHKKGDQEPAHFHEHSVECNVLVSGSMNINGIEFEAGDIFTILPDEVARAEFHEDCTIVVVRTPSLPTDKVEVK